jgi:hypothetical protein
MVTVFLIDGETRLHLPGTPWGFKVRTKLVSLGHKVQATDWSPEPDVRSPAELARRDELLDSTGL